jgi:transposase
MLTTLFSLPAHLLVEDVLIENQVLTLVITSTLAEMPCPECRQPTKRIHSRYTLLRLVRRATALPFPTPQVLGVDDFAWKKGDRYGTILVDLQAHHVVDLLPDREAETFVSWLKTHPGVKIISRDRAGTYADGARRGAPQAIQVADRFHLLLNLTTALQKLFERKQDILQRLAAEEQAARLSAPTYESAAVPVPPAPVPESIAARLRLHRDTVRRYLNASGFPEIVRPGKRSKLDPYKAYLQERWAAGQRNIKQLVDELRERGYRHGETIIYDYLRRMREQPAWLPAYTAAKKQAPTASQLPLSAHEAAWLFARNPQRLRLMQVVKLDNVRRADEDLEAAYQLAQDFRVMVTKRQEAVLDRWLKEAKGSGIAELQSLAAGILRDAGCGACRLDAALQQWTNRGPCE